jgi:hypothetical protein
MPPPPAPPPPGMGRDDATGAENADVEVPKPRRRTRYSLSGKLNLTSQRESIRAMSDSRGKHDRVRIVRAKYESMASILHRVSDPLLALIAFESFGCALSNEREASPR